MSKAKHIEGPWTADLEEIEIGETIEIFSSEGVLICQVANVEDFPCLDDDQIDEVSEQAYVNAHLIAAAPELLAACQAALNIAHYTTNELSYLKIDDKRRALTWTKKVFDIQEQIKTAIAKAEGRSCSESKEGQADTLLF